MKNQEAFTYCWTDHKTNMLYVGYHKGQQDDGYVCSSKWMLEEYKKRPEDFTRMILAEGTADDCWRLEITILKSADAMHSARFYNQNNGEGLHVCKHQTTETRAKISNKNKGKRITQKQKDDLRLFRLGRKTNVETRKNISKGLIERYKKYGVSEDTREKLRKLNIGKNNPMYGKTLSIDRKKEISIQFKGKPKTSDHREKISNSLMGREFSKEHCAKISFSKKGKKQSEEQIKKSALARTGKKQSKETIKKRSDSMKGKPSPLKGTKQSEERIKKQRVAIRKWRENRKKPS